MAEDEFTQLRIKKYTRRKIAILAKVLENVTIYSLVEYWADQEWQEALKAGLVTKAMLDPTGHFVQAEEKS